MMACNIDCLFAVAIASSGSLEQNSNLIVTDYGAGVIYNKLTCECECVTPTWSTPVALRFS